MNGRIPGFRKHDAVGSKLLLRKFEFGSFPFSFSCCHGTWCVQIKELSTQDVLQRLQIAEVGGVSFISVCARLVERKGRLEKGGAVNF